jgi:hypothetical protein
MLPTPDFTRPLPVRRSFPQPLPPVAHFGYNPHSSQASGSVQPVYPAGPPPRSWAFSASGSPEKSVFVGRRRWSTAIGGTITP